jgi:hypothetical protein
MERELKSIFVNYTYSRLPYNILGLDDRDENENYDQTQGAWRRVWLSRDGRRGRVMPRHC